MRVIIQKNYDNCSQWVAEYIAKKIQEFEPSAEKPFVLGLPTGSTPIGTYQHLKTMCRDNLVSFKHVVTFNMDEYVHLPKEHPQSYHTFMEEAFFSEIDIERKNTHILDGTAKDLEAECELYEQKIKDVGGIRLFLAGMGEDGHLAFNEPGSSLASRTRIKTLTEDTRIVNARFFDNDSQAVPKTALTVGVATVMDAKEIVLIATGYKKAHALKACVEEGVNHMYTASCLQLHPKSALVCDDAATDYLTVKTVRYFKEIEQGNIL